MNILILSCGTRNKIIQYFKRELEGKGKVIATDCNILAPALYEADKHYIVPKFSTEGYIDEILSICKENNIKGVLSLIDPELEVISKNRQAFLEIGSIPIVCDMDVIEMSSDKYKMYNFLVDNNFKTAKSYVDKEKFLQDIESGEVNYPVFIKPVYGSASININKVNSNEEVELLYGMYDNLMIQEYIDGTEYGVDVYIDMLSGETVALFAKEKIKMRAGETDKSISYKDKKLTELVKEFVEKANFKGIIDIDIFKVNGEYYISEVNPRFGGGYPHAYESGINVPRMILNNIRGKINTISPEAYEEGTYMMKYNEIKVTKLDG